MNTYSCAREGTRRERTPHSRASPLAGPMEVVGGHMMETEYAWQKMWDESVLRRLCAEMGASSLSYPLVQARRLRLEQ